LQPRHNLLAFFGIEYADLLQHPCMCQRAFDIVVIEALVKFHRSGKGLDKGIGRFVKTPAPRLVSRFVLATLVYIYALGRKPLPYNIFLSSLLMSAICIQLIEKPRIISLCCLPCWKTIA